MDPNSDPTTTTTKQVTVDVPEDRIAEFHAFFGRFLAGRVGRGRGGRPGRRHHRAHGRGCAGRHSATEHGEAPGQAAGTTEV
jgi:hypothetical protein